MGGPGSPHVHSEVDSNRLILESICRDLGQVDLDAAKRFRSGSAVGIYIHRETFAHTIMCSVQIIDNTDFVPMIAVPALLELDRHFWTDKEMRALKGNWERIVTQAINSASDCAFPTALVRVCKHCQECRHWRDQLPLKQPLTKKDRPPLKVA
jgi:hypothetical protein